LASHKKALLVLLTIVIAVTCIESKQALGLDHGTEISGLITSDAVWSKANSPYRIMGPVGIAENVTLRIEPGVSFEYGFEAGIQYYIQVNGTLTAKGTSTDPIRFGSLGIKFMSDSSNWNDQTGSGCIIENAIMGSLTIEGASPKLNSNLISGDIEGKGAPIISNNAISGYIGVNAAGGSSFISNNNITGYIVLSGSNSSIIANNNIYGLESYDSFGRSSVTNYAVSVVESDSTVIAGNKISGSFGVCIAVEEGTATIQNNSIVNKSGSAISISKDASAFIQNNTIASNVDSYAIVSYSSKSSTVIFNDFQGNAAYNIYLSTGASGDIDARSNWWGTTDQQVISQSIFDNKNDFNLGTVTFTPFLNQPNPEAPKITDSTSPTPTPETPEYPVWIALAILVIAVSATVLISKKKVSSNKT
jgi:hypothetical protein